MSVCIITGSGGLVGGESAAFFAEKGFSVVGIDNDMRSRFFGDAASTKWQTEQLRSRYRDYHAVDEDIRDEAAMERVVAGLRDTHAGLEALFDRAAEARP